MNSASEPFRFPTQIASILLRLCKAYQSLQEFTDTQGEQLSSSEPTILQEIQEEIKQSLLALQEALPSFTYTTEETSHFPPQVCALQSCLDMSTVSYGAFSLCDLHSSEWIQRQWRWCVACFAENQWQQISANELSGRCQRHGGNDYRPPNMPESLPFPASLSLHGLPSDTEMQGIQEALEQSGVPNLPEEQTPTPLSPYCFWNTSEQTCTEARVSGSPFCREHRIEGEQRLTEEANAAPNLGRFLSRMNTRGFLPSLFGWIAQSIAQNRVSDAERVPSCIAGDCSLERLTGHAFCEQHLPRIFNRRHA